MIKSFKSKRLWAAVAIIFIFAAIWLMPFKCKTVNIKLFVPGVQDGTKAEFTLFSEQAYNESYTVTAHVNKQTVSFKLDNEYIDVHKIVVSDSKVAQAAEKMNVNANAFEKSDYTAATINGEIFYLDQNRNYVFSQEALNTIKSGIANPWGARLLVTVFVLFILFVCAGFRLLKKYFGSFKAGVVCTAFCAAMFLILQLRIDEITNEKIRVFSSDIKKSVIVVIVTACVFVFIALCVLLKDTKNKKLLKRFIICIYAFVLIFSGFKLWFYCRNVGNTPDEAVHIGYVAYLSETGEIMPEHENIRMVSCITANKDKATFKFVDGTVSYLKHPPFYYHIMRLAGSVKFNNDSTFTVNLNALRIFSMSFVVAALVLMFYIGYTRIKASPIVHLLYAAVCTCVPMLIYTAAGVNNDSLTLFSVTVFFLGILRFCEKKRNFLTYLLIALSITVTVLTKITAGIIVAVAALIVLAVTIKKEKCFKELISARFLLTLPVYFLGVVYFAIFYLKYGSIQPNIFVMNPEYARSTHFYVDIANRSTKSLLGYSRYFVKNFMKTWTGIASHITLIKPQNEWISFQNFATVSMWFYPLLLLSKKVRSNYQYTLAVLAGYIGVFTAFVLQLNNGFNIFLSRGYAGGYQSRYYLCAIVFFAFLIATVLQTAENKLAGDNKYKIMLNSTLQTAAVAYTGLLFYQDFIYFVTYYNNYI